jgi:SIR2-like protein
MVANLESRTTSANGLDEKDWDKLLRHISKGKCTPFIGSDACAGLYPPKSDRAQKWSDEEDYPLDDRTELARVAQFLAVRDYPARPIERLVEEFESIQSPDFSDPYEVHSVLADLPVPVYITTNYDNFMSQAFEKKLMKRNVQSEYCRWRDGSNSSPSVFSGEYKPSPANPVVFHLYGRIDEERSLVLTENDYLQFLVNVTRSEKLIPPVIQGAITDGSILFLGYQLDEWDFRVLFHIIQSYLERALTKAHIAVQIVPTVQPPNPEQVEKVTQYLNSYFEKTLYTRIYWGSCQEFVAELKARWETSRYAKQ